MRLLLEPAVIPSNGIHAALVPARRADPRVRNRRRSARCPGATFTLGVSWTRWGGGGLGCSGADGFAERLGGGPAAFVEETDAFWWRRQRRVPEKRMQASGLVEGLA